MATDDSAGDQQGIIRRNRPGTKTADLYNWPDQDYTDMDSTLDGKENDEIAWLEIASCHESLHVSDQLSE